MSADKAYNFAVDSSVTQSYFSPRKVFKTKCLSGVLMDAVILDNSEWVCAVCDLWVLVTSYSAFCTTRPGVLWGKSGRLLNPVWL